MSNYKDFQAELAKLKAKYPQVLLIIKDETGPTMWDTTDKNWALGACTRYLACIADDDRWDKQAYMASKARDA